MSIKLNINTLTNKNMMKRVMLFFIAISLTSCFLKKGNSTKTSHDQKIEMGWRDFSGLDLNMTGVVTFVNKDVRGGNFHGRGIFRINILNSNIDYYDPRDIQKNYYCVIKDGKAEVYDNHVFEMEIGDTVQIDTKEQLIKWLNKSADGRMYSISVGEVSFFSYIKENNLQGL